MTYLIAEAAELSGFSPATLRYYEEVGVMPPPARSGAGYRQYVDRDLERLAFVARARDLGCTLAEIAELARVWEGNRCAPVKEHLRALVASKAAEAERRILGTRAFVDQLQDAQAGLAEPPVDGPCDDLCGCTTPSAPPVACTLEAGQIEQRLADWRALSDRAARRVPIEGGVRLELDGELVTDATRLAAAEHDCCSFFSFALTLDRRGVGLEVTAPPEARQLVDALLAVSRSDD